MRLPPGTAVLACKVFAPELKMLNIPSEKISFLEQGLHNHPLKLRKELGLALNSLEKDPSTEEVVLLYGYCGSGLEGLSSKRVRLRAPLVHDCIPLLLDSSLPPDKLSTSGLFFLSAGWIDHGKTPLTEYYQTCKRYDPETALWIAKETLKSYTKVALITEPGLIQDHHRNYARRMAKLFGLEYQEVKGGLGWLTSLLTRQKKRGSLSLEPGCPVSLEHYAQASSSGTASRFDQAVQLQIESDCPETAFDQ
ncbi:DUF1638 domain-containing protein [Dethiosulfatarculus sandiegensis]|nr:DUF1638 domain-containing protein [Dethiosulfatarculus sandiegensis]